MNANSNQPKASPEIGSRILGCLHGTFNSQAEILTTGPVQWNSGLQRYYVTGYRVIQSKGRLSKNELRFCLIDFEKFNK